MLALMRFSLKFLKLELKNSKRLVDLLVYFHEIRVPRPKIRRDV